MIGDIPKSITSTRRKDIYDYEHEIQGGQMLREQIAKWECDKCYSRYASEPRDCMQGYELGKCPGYYDYPDQILTLFKDWFKQEVEAEVTREIMSQIEEFYHKPHLYHYRCWASGTVLVRDEWGEEPMYQCHSYDGDFNCGCRKCPWGTGLIRGELELQDFERHQNSIIDDILRNLKAKRLKEGHETNRGTG